MKTILINAYAISPTKGSEFSVGWNFVTNLAKKNKVILLCGCSDEHMGEMCEIINYFKDNKPKNITLIPIKPPGISLFLNFFNRIGLNYIFYFALYFWQKKTYKIAKNIIEAENVDIIHQLNLTGFREPGFLWKLNKPFVWGPVSGVNHVEWELTKRLPFKARILFSVKNIITSLQLKYSPRVRSAVEKSSAILFTTKDTKRSFTDIFGNLVNGYVIPEQSIYESVNIKNPPCTKIKSKLKLLYVGSLFYIKNVYFLIDVISNLNDKVDIELTIVGSGHLEYSLKALSKELKVDNTIKFLGNIPRNKIFEIMSNSDLFCMCSLSEGNPAVIFESISCLLPIISLNQNGMADILSDDLGFLIDVCDYDKTVNDYSNKIIDIFNNREMLSCAKNKMLKKRNDLSWETKINNLNVIYENDCK